jgi:hypothetical protein
MRAWWGTTSTLSGWPTRWPTRHAGVCSRPHGPSGLHLRLAVPHPQAAGDRGRAAHPAGTGAAAGPRHYEDRTRGRQVGESQQHQVASVVGSSVTVPNRGSMRIRSSPATSKFRNPPSSPRDTTDVSGVAPAGRWARHQTHEGWSVVTAGVRDRGDGRRRTRPALLYGRKAPRGGGLRSCRTTPFAACRWPG